MASFMKEMSVFLAFVVSIFIFLHNKLLVICIHHVICPLCALLFIELRVCPPLLCANSLQTLRALISFKGDFPAFLGALQYLSPGKRLCISFSHYHIILKVSLYLIPLLYCKLLEGRHHCNFHLFFFFFSPVLKIVTINI